MIKLTSQQLPVQGFLVFDDLIPQHLLVAQLGLIIYLKFQWPCHVSKKCNKNIFNIYNVLKIYNYVYLIYMTDMYFTHTYTYIYNILIYI